jgi:outer membrane receptor for ferrienterochelin and colicin
MQQFSELVRFGPLRRIAIAAAFLCTGGVSAARAQESDPAQPSGSDLSELSLEDLMQITVSSASRKDQLLDDVPAAIFVLSHEDLRRSGVTSIPEALRLVPGVDVARLDANRWAVSSRGFNGQFANKMLVLVDGQSVHSFNRLSVDSTATDPGDQGEKVSQNQARLRVQDDLGEHVEYDITVIYVDALALGNVESYIRMDNRSEWRPKEGLSLVAGVQNLFHDQAVEFGPSEFGPSRQSLVTFYAGVSWSF